MRYLIKIFFILLISYNSFANENKVNQILFKINNKVYTNIDLEHRKEYVGIVNNFKQSEFSKKENIEIFNDYISSLIFYEYYIKNKIEIKNLENEIELIFNKNIQKIEEVDQIKTKNLKFNILIDLVRNKIIEEKLNSKKSSLLQEVSQLDLIYNYNLQNLIIKENLIDKKLIKNIDNRKKFNDLKIFLEKNNINFFYKEEDINDKNTVSNKIKNIIDQKTQIYISNSNGYINLISIKKNLESYKGIFVKLINFKSSTQLEKNDLKCEKLNETIDIDKTIFKEYEYSKLNNKIKDNLKSINDYIVFNNNDEYNYIVLCDMTYDEELLKNINFNKNVNALVGKIQKAFLKKYKNEFKFIKVN